MKKEYGKLTADQLREFIQLLPDVFSLMRDTNDILARAPAAKFDSVMEMTITLTVRLTNFHSLN